MAAIATTSPLLLYLMIPNATSRHVGSLSPSCQSPYSGWGSARRGGRLDESPCSFRTSVPMWLLRGGPRAGTHRKSHDHGRGPLMCVLALRCRHSLVPWSPDIVTRTKSVFFRKPTTLQFSSNLPFKCPPREHSAVSFHPTYYGEPQRLTLVVSAYYAPIRCVSIPILRNLQFLSVFHRSHLFLTGDSSFIGRAVSTGRKGAIRFSALAGTEESSRSSGSPLCGRGICEERPDGITINALFALLSCRGRLRRQEGGDFADSAF
jgi:hypothetical protein